MHQPTWSDIVEQLEAGQIRAASQTPDGDWEVNPEVKDASGDGSARAVARRMRGL